MDCQSSGDHSGLDLWYQHLADVLDHTGYQPNTDLGQQ